jgi:hypothetical protein
MPSAWQANEKNSDLSEYLRFSLEDHADLHGHCMCICRKEIVFPRSSSHNQYCEFEAFSSGSESGSNPKNGL